MSEASSRCLAKRICSMGLMSPSSIQCLWIATTLYTLDIMTTKTVAATVFTTIGPRSRLILSIPIITSFLNGVLNTKVTINAISVKIRVNNNWIIEKASFDKGEGLGYYDRRRPFDCDIGIEGYWGLMKSLSCLVEPEKGFGVY